MTIKEAAKITRTGEVGMSYRHHTSRSMLALAWEQGALERSSGAASIRNIVEVSNIRENAVGALAHNATIKFTDSQCSAPFHKRFVRVSRRQR